MARIRHSRGELLFRRPLPLWKRAVDVIGAGAGIILFAPLFLAIAVLIKLVSPGPVFFKQRRVGAGGESFLVWKFRTMKHKADTSAHQQHVAALIRASADGSRPRVAMRKLERDPRIIRFGNFLRKSCLDELPQLFNVFLGEMSLVGPRPATEYEVQEYDPWHKARLDATPGMTGLWQVSGKNRLTFHQMVSLDIRYARECSPLLDVKIFLKTIPAILMQLRETTPRREERALC